MTEQTSKQCSCGGAPHVFGCELYNQGRAKTDLVARLRAVNPTRHIKLLVNEAADEIERWRSECICIKPFDTKPGHHHSVECPRYSPETPLKGGQWVDLHEPHYPPKGAEVRMRLTGTPQIPRWQIWLEGAVNQEAPRK